MAQSALRALARATRAVDWFFFVTGTLLIIQIAWLATLTNPVLTQIFHPRTYHTAWGAAFHASLLLPALYSAGLAFWCLARGSKRTDVRLLTLFLLFASLLLSAALSTSLDDDVPEHPAWMEYFYVLTTASTWLTLAAFLHFSSIYPPSLRSPRTQRWMRVRRSRRVAVFTRLQGVLSKPLTLWVTAFALAAPASLLLINEYTAPGWIWAIVSTVFQMLAVRRAVIQGALITGALLVLDKALGQVSQIFDFVPPWSRPLIGWAMVFLFFRRFRSKIERILRGFTGAQQHTSAIIVGDLVNTSDFPHEYPNDRRASVQRFHSAAEGIATRSGARVTKLGDSSILIELAEPDRALADGLAVAEEYLSQRSKARVLPPIRLAFTQGC